MSNKTKVIWPKSYEFTPATYHCDECVAARVSCILRATVDHIVFLSPDNPLKTIDVSDESSDQSVWFKVVCDGLPNGHRYILVDPNCTRFMSLLNYNTVRKTTTLKISAHDREILLLAINLYMSNML